MILSLRDRMMAFGRLAVKLARDTTGNTLAIAAAAIIPLAALVGGGVDMSRAYMAQSRLQQACDAGALAGRRAMTTGSVDSTVRAEALKFFRFNFPTGESSSTTPPYGVASFTPTVTDGTDSAVVITASTTVPTTIMSMFGYTTVPINVTCNAKQDFVNTDIVLVLDTTGSMANKAVSTDTDTKIVALRKAVLSLYDQLAATQTNLESHGLRLRYGVVPYASSVNVGKLLRVASTSNIVSDNWDYQSRVANYTTPNYSGGTNSAESSQTTEIYSGSISQSQCSSWGNATTTTGTPPGALTVTTYVNNAVNNSSSSTTDWGWSSASDNSGSSRSCRRKYSSHTMTGYTTTYTFTSWTYRPENYDVSGYAGGSVTIAAGTGSDQSGSPGGSVTASGTYDMRELVNAPGASGINTATSTWDGCIEERQTTTSITSSTTAVPSSAYDLDITLVPTGDKTTKWKPYWKDIEFLDPSKTSYNYGGIYQKPQWACPAEARRMQAWDRSTLSTYLDTLNPDGGTYHDNGIIWGAHIISPNGVFSSDNPNTYNNMPVNRFMIFMTDGLLDTGYDTLYTTYGVEQLDGRVTGGGSSSNETDQASRHRQRFKLMCSAVKGMGVSIWVVAFASSLDTDLTNCASNSSQASTSTNSAQLNAKFVEIGKEIGALRLTK